MRLLIFRERGYVDVSAGAAPLRAPHREPRIIHVLDAGSAAPGSWPLIGRERELTRIAAARAEGAPAVAICADAGIGKTHLARHALDQAGGTGAFDTWVHVTRSSTSIPLAAFGGLVPPGTSLENEAGFIQVLVTELREQAAGREIVVGVDDAQLLDPASATFLLHLAEHAVAFVIATIRSGDPCPDAVTALWKDAGALRLDLDSLGDPELAELIETVLDGPLERDAHHWIAQSSQGNVLYAQQLLAGALEHNALISEDGLWRLTRQPAASNSLRELIDARIGTLSDDERRGLELLAIGEPLSLDEAVKLMGTQTLGELEAHRLAVVDSTAAGDREVRVAHPLYGELISAQMPVSWSRAHRARLAQLVAARPERSPADAVRIAQWLTDAGEAVSADTLLGAAKAVNLAGTESGLQFAQRAIEAGAGAEANMVLAATHTVHGRAAEAETTLAEVEDGIEDRALALEYLRQRTTGLQWGLGRAQHAVDLLDRAITWWPEETWHRQVEILRLPFVALTKPPGTCTPALEQALKDDALSGQARRWLGRALAVDLFWAGKVREAHGMLPEIPQLPLREALDFLDFATYSVIGLASGCDLAGLDRDMRDAFEGATAAADPAAAGLAAATVAAVSYLAGRFLDCRRWLNEAIAQSERQDPFGTRPLARSLQVGVSLALGDHARASAAADRLETDAAGTGAAAQRGVTPWIARGRAWARLAQAEPPPAQELLLEAAVELAWAPIYDAELRYEAMRAGKPARELAPDLRRLRQRCDAPITSAYAEHTTARAESDAGGMLQAAESFAALGATRYASEAAAHAAAAFAAEGRQDSARRAAARSRDLQPTGQGAGLPQIEGIDDTAIELTPREAQMVELAARGLTNAEIADRLVLSKRTVETHIYRAMRKLGINDRREFPTQS
jgi:DNA-binding NarL/FixJ family response regulator